MVESLSIHMVEHQGGYHVYVWRVQTHGRTRKRRQVSVVWIPAPAGPLQPPDLLRSLAGVLLTPPSQRPSPPPA